MYIRAGFANADCLLRLTPSEIALNGCDKACTADSEGEASEVCVGQAPSPPVAHESDSPFNDGAHPHAAAAGLQTGLLSQTLNSCPGLITRTFHHGSFCIHALQSKLPLLSLNADAMCALIQVGLLIATITSNPIRF